MDTVFLFCRDASAGADGKLDIHGVFNELYAPDFPARQERMVLVGIVEWPRERAGRIPFSIDFKDPEELAVYSIEGHTEVDARPRSRPPARSHFILPMENVTFPTPGCYSVTINIDGADLSGPSMHLMRSG